MLFFASRYVFHKQNVIDLWGLAALYAEHSIYFTYQSIRVLGKMLIEQFQFFQESVEFLFIDSFEYEFVISWEKEELSTLPTVTLHNLIDLVTISNQIKTFLNVRQTIPMNQARKYLRSVYSKFPFEKWKSGQDICLFLIFLYQGRINFEWDKLIEVYLLDMFNLFHVRKVLFIWYSYPRKNSHDLRDKYKVYLIVFLLYVKDLLLDPDIVKMIYFFLCQSSLWQFFLWRARLRVETTSK